MHARCVDQLHHHEHQRQAEHRGQAQRDAAEIILRRGGGGGSGGGHADLRISVPAACASRASTQSPCAPPRSEERRVGKEWASTCSSRWSREHEKKKKTKNQTQTK